MKRAQKEVTGKITNEPPPHSTSEATQWSTNKITNDPAGGAVPLEQLDHSRSGRG